MVEKGKLLYLHLPSDGLDLEAFLGQDKVKDTILTVTRNEGKPKNSVICLKKLGFEVENLNQYPELPEVEETGMTLKRMLGWC